MKVLAMYLPQFHRTKENDEWWGEGFTEWTAAKTAAPLFVGHKQPHIPYKQNYYNLLNKETMGWQADLLKKYGIDGLVFYHYYFKDGRMMLEKPVENLRTWKDINIPYCFAWANESWIRSWSNITDGNPWSQVFDNQVSVNGDTGILLEQAYGDEEQWEEHFNYLLPFFKDERYIYEDGKPVFIFYCPNNIPCLNEMVQYWNNLAKRNGLTGVYTIGVGSKDDCLVDERVNLEPQYAIENNLQIPFEEQHVRMILDYDVLWESIIRRREQHTNCLSGFVGYDDTPRRGRNGIVIKGASPEKFKKYMQLLFCKAKKEKSKFILINAWNEWGEGMYLEPDEENAFGYLEAFQYAKNHYEDRQDEFEDVYTVNAKGEILLKENASLRARMERFKALWKVTDSWMTAREQYDFVVNKMISRNYHTIAIYGMGSLGKHLLWEIEQYNSKHPEQMILVKYGIDQGGKTCGYSFPVYRLTDILSDVDAVIVTVTYEFEHIRAQLNTIINCEIVSLESLLMK